MIVNLKLTFADYQMLILMLGYAAGAKTRAEGDIPESWGEITDWILVQGGHDNYTYTTNRDDLIRKKGMELVLAEENE